MAMGMSKHRKSGRVPQNKTNTMGRARETNRELEKQLKLREKRRAQGMVETFGQLFKGT